MQREATSWDTWLTSSGRRQIEHLLSNGYLVGQRWFGAKARSIASVHLTDHLWLPYAKGWLLLGLIELAFADGGSEGYVVFFSLAAPHTGQAMLMLVQDAPTGTVSVIEAADDPDAVRVLLRFVGEQRVLPTARGELRGERLLPLEPEADRLPVLRSQAEQSNTNLRIGDRYVLKLFRRALPGLNPDYEIGRFLLQKTRFRRVPPLAGAILYQRREQEPMVLAMLQSWIPNQGDGWEQAVAQIQALLARSARDDEIDALAGASGWLGNAARLGQCTAELHLALASGSDDPSFRPEELTDADLASLAARMRNNFDMGMSLLAERQAKLPAPLRDAAARIGGRRKELAQRIHKPPHGPYPKKIRCHGDYHLGQVLCTDGDFVILDFEGEPSRPLAERRAKQSPLKDVAGMLRSFSYATQAALLRFQQQASHPTRLAPVWRLFESEAASAFLESYRRQAGEAPFLPADPEQFSSLLDYFILDKALYELLYELNSRPDWVGIPLMGLEQLLG